MSRKAFFAAHCTHRFDPLHWGGDCLKSQIFLSENRESAFGLVGVRSISVSRGLFGQSGGDSPLELAYIRCSGMILDNSTYHCSALELAL